MAAATLTSANVRTIQAWVEGDLAAKRRIGKRVEVHTSADSTAAGGEVNVIPASAFGLSVIEEVTTPYNADTKRAVCAVPNEDGSLIYMFTAVDNSSAPADVALAATPSGLYFVVKGY